LGNAAAAAAGSSVAALAAHVLSGRHQQRSHLSSLCSSLESANLLLLGSSAAQSPRRRRQQQQHEPGAEQLDSSRGRAWHLYSVACAFVRVPLKGGLLSPLCTSYRAGLVTAYTYNCCVCEGYRGTSC
jgi:hypothetical protein